MTKYVIATRTYKKIKRAVQDIEGWKKGGTLKPGTSIFEVKRKAIIKNADQGGEID